MPKLKYARDLFKALNYLITHPLNRGSALAAVTRFVRWQVGSRILPGRSVLPFVADTELVVARGMTGATGNWYCGLHEHDDMGFLLHSLRAEDLFIDIGANIGSYTILAGGVVGATVIAVEPVPKTFENLSRNVYWNNLQALVTILNIGIGQVAGELKFTSNLDTVNHVISGKERTSSEAISVTVDTLDALCPNTFPTMIKIDVEGFELAALKGGGKVLASPHLKAVIMETNGSGARYGWEDSELIDLMNRHGFSTYTYNAISRCLESAPAHVSGNSLFIRDEQFIRERIASAERFSLVNGHI